MSMTFVFEITVNIDEAKAAKNLDYALESAREFSEELNQWINKHPFIEGCTLSEKK